MRNESELLDDTTHDMERWTSARLAATVPGTTRGWWKRTMAPELARRGVLRKIGRGWFGRRGEIVAALAAGVE